MNDEQKTSETLTDEVAENTTEGTSSQQSAEAQGDSVQGAHDGNNWKQEVQALESQVVELKEQMLRVQADAQNVRRRAEQDVEKAHKFALEKFARELLPVIDSLEKAVETIKGDDEQIAIIRQGVELTLSMFLSGIKKFNVVQIDPMGEPFDPLLHEAISMVEAAAAEPNSVVAVVQKGYTLNDRLVRPAMVVVSKGVTKIDAQA